MPSFQNCCSTYRKRRLGTSSCYCRASTPLPSWSISSSLTALTPARFGAVASNLPGESAASPSGLLRPEPAAPPRPTEPRVTSRQQIALLFLGQFAAAPIPPQDCDQGPRITVVLLAPPQVLRQRAVGLNTLDPQLEDSPGPGILDRKAPVDGRSVAEAAGSRGLVARAERHHAVAGLGKRP